MPDKSTRGKIKDKKAAILDAALSLITQYGFHGTSMKMIAQHANIAAGTIYVHFSNKDEMIHALYLQIGNHINDTIDTVQLTKSTVEANFKALMHAILNLYIADPRYAEFLTQYIYSPYIASPEGHPDMFLAPVNTFFAEGIKQKKIKPISIPALIALSHGPITSLVRMAKYTSVKFDARSLNRLVDACWDGIKA